MVHAQGTALGFSETAVSSLDCAAARGRLDRKRRSLNICLVVIAHRVHERLPLIVAGNRDEFHARPTQDAHWWPVDSGDLQTLGGRDSQAGGTWLALARNGRFATVTNYRDALPPAGDLRSRGELVTNFLSSALSPVDYVNSLEGDLYAGFNLVVIDGGQAAYASNRGAGTTELEPGVYGVANATLDTPWEKVERSKSRLNALIGEDSVDESHLFNLLGDRQKASASEVKSSRLPFEKAHAMTSPFIVQADYGTRCSTVVLRDAGGHVRFSELRFLPDGRNSGRSDFEFLVA
ncbi:MAG: NRDE family protein [Woeseiaceae bacterium]